MQDSNINMEVHADLLGRSSMDSRALSKLEEVLNVRVLIIFLSSTRQHITLLASLCATASSRSLASPITYQGTRYQVLFIIKRNSRTAVGV